MNIQFKKGVLEICVLSVLARRDCYGYELVNEISKTIDISEGTIYPLLRRLKDEGLVTTYLQESGEGPPRKYYRSYGNGTDKRTGTTGRMEAVCRICERTAGRRSSCSRMNMSI